MVFDPYKDSAVQKRIQELQQKKYRQGHRNATDLHGNPAYVLTDDERISCLSQQMQQVVRNDMTRIKTLENYAQPFSLTVGIGDLPPNYVVNITHPQLGYARRQGVAAAVDSMGNPELWFKQQIDSMKHELGYKEPPADPSEPPGKFLKMQEDKRAGSAPTTATPRVLHCPEHGNEMVRGQETGTLVCTVLGCTKVARKKEKPSSPVPTPAVAESAAEKQEVDPELVEDLMNIEKYLGATVSASAVLPDFSAQASEAAALNIQKLLDTAGLLGVAMASRTPNQNVPKILQESSRWYLVQAVSPGREVYVDITMCYPDVIMNKLVSGAIETTVTLNNVRPY